MPNSPRFIALPELKTLLREIDLSPLIAEGFIAYSEGEAVVPPVGELILEDPPGEVHIKYGYILDDDHYVIKIASGFYKNVELGIPWGNGMMLLFSQHTGEPEAILLDEGYLTDIRTAVAGAVAAGAMAPEEVTRIGIVGTGVQARLQLRYLSTVTDCTKVLVCGRSESKLHTYASEMSAFGFEVETTMDISQIGATCNLIVMTTPAKEPLLKSEHVREGTHITAMGSDTPEKQEVDSLVLQRADLVVADSISQCLTRGEIHHAINNGDVRENELVELGDLLSGREEWTRRSSDITIADLTGVAVQDIQIAKAVYLEAL